MTIESLGLNAGLIVAINLIIEAIKRWDKNNKLAKLQVLMPLILAFPAALLVTDWGKNGMAFTQTYVLNVVLYAALSGYAYKLAQSALAFVAAKPVAPAPTTPGQPPVVVAVDTSAVEKAQGK